MGDIPQRLGAVRADLAGQGLGALVVSQPDNRRYLTGFTGSAGVVLVSADRAMLLTDSRYYGQAEREAPDFSLERVGYRVFERLSEVLGELDLKRVGFEADAVTVSELERLRGLAPEVEWRATSGLVERHRAIKSEAEIGTIRCAAAIADAAMAHAAAVLRPGISELALAWEIEVFMREHGAEGLAFDTIVAAGENGALPHHHPSQRRIEAGEPVVVDIGARVDGYNSDLTRTFALGPVRDPEFETVYAIVAEANRTATRGIRAGLTGADADRLARDVIDAAGYGDFFGHGLGHGVGLQIHEGPRLSFLADEHPLGAGMVITIEPGIYLPGRFGVRIEDLVVVRDNGVEVLSAVEKQPAVVPA